MSGTGTSLKFLFPEARFFRRSLNSAPKPVYGATRYLGTTLRCQVGKCLHVKAKVLRCLQMLLNAYPLLIPLFIFLMQGLSH